MTTATITTTMITTTITTTITTMITTMITTIITAVSYVYNNNGIKTSTLEVFDNKKIMIRLSAWIRLHDCLTK